MQQLLKPAAKCSQLRKPLPILTLSMLTTLEVLAGEEGPTTENKY